MGPIQFWQDNPGSIFAWPQASTKSFKSAFQLDIMSMKPGLTVQNALLSCFAFICPKALLNELNGISDIRALSLTHKKYI